MGRIVNGNQNVVMEMENYITLPLDAIIRALINKLESEVDKLRFIDFVRRLQEVYRVRMARKHEMLQQGFDMFMPREHSGKIVDESSISFEEDAFLDQLHQAMVSANYKVLSQKEYDAAIAAEYTLEVDLKIDTKKLDSGFIKRFLLNHPDDPMLQTSADVVQDVLVYHRGVGMDETEGFFALQKVDYLLGKVLWIGWYALMAVVYALQFWRWTEYFEWFSKLKAPSVETDEEVSPYDKKTVVTRRSLAGVLSSSWTAFFTKVRLREPTWKDIIIVYRRKSDVRNAPPVVNIKSFKDIPIADFEAILPESEPQTRSMDLVKLLVALTAGFAAVVHKVISFKEDLEDDDGETLMEELKGLIPILVMTGSYAAKLIVQFNAQRAKYQQTITQYLYHKSSAADDGVRSKLTESVRNQEVKEAVLAFFFLWQKSSGCVEDLDDECEAFLGSLGEHVDFEVEDAVQKLIRDGLVATDGQELSRSTALRCLTISRAISKIEQIWANYFQDKTQGCPYCPYLEDHGNF